MIEREINRLDLRLSGVRNMKKLPDMLFVVDVTREATAVHEANLRNIPVIALVDTNCDPGNIDYVIPSNDDAIRAIKLLVGKIADAALEGKTMRKEEEIEEAMPVVPEGEQMVVVSRGQIEEDVDLADTDLLGEATLAKMGGPRVDEAEVLAEEITAEEGVETPVEEIAEAPEEVKSEEPVKAKPKAKAKTEDKQEVDAEPAVEEKPKAVAKPKAETKTKTESQAKAKSKSEVKPDSKEEPEAKAEKKTTPRAKKTKADKAEEKEEK